MRISDWSSDVCSSDLGADRQPLRAVAADALGVALAHFLCRLVGEGDRGDAPGRMAARADQVRALLPDHPGLAAARACEHQPRALDVASRLGLLAAEAVHRAISRRRRPTYPAGRRATESQNRQTRPP